MTSSVRRRGLAVILALLWWGRPVAAQTFSPDDEISTAGADCSTATTCAGFSTATLAAFGIHLNVGTSGTFQFEVSQDATGVDNGTWTAWTDVVNSASSATADGSYYFANPGFRFFRVRASAINGAATLSVARGYSATTGGGGGTFNGVLKDAAGGDDITDTANNALRVNVVAGGGSGGTSSTFGAAFPGPGTAAGFSDGTNMQGARVYDTDSGAGTQYTLGVELRAAASGGSAAIAGDAANGLDVDVTRLPLLAEDAAHVSGDSGFFALGVRNDSLTALTSANGDYSPISVNNAGVLFSQGTGVAGTPAGGVLSVQGVSGGTALAVSQSGTWTVQPGNTANSTPWLFTPYQGAANLFATAAAAADNMSNPTTTWVLSANMCFDGSTWDRCASTTGGSGAVDANTSRVTIATDDDVSDAATLFEANLVAHDAADAGNPLKVGAKVETSLAGATLPVDGDRTDALADADSAIYVRTYGSLADIAQDRATNTDGASTAFAGGLAAPAAGVRLYLTSCTLANSSATAVTVDIRDGAAGSVLWTFPVPANTSGVTHTWTVPLKFTAATAVAYDASAAVTTLTVSCNGFKSKAG